MSTQSCHAEKSCFDDHAEQFAGAIGADGQLLVSAGRQ